MVPSSSDEILAKEACALLVSWGRPDLTVSPEQVLRWRQAGYLPVLSNGLGGRGRATEYAPEAVQVAAALATELASFRNLDQAALSAFVQYAVSRGRRGGRVPLIRLKRAGRDYITELEEACKQARAASKQAGGRRSAIPRKLRVPFSGSRRAGSGEATDAMLSLALGHLEAHEVGTVVHAVAGEEGIDALDDEPEALPEMPALQALIGQLALGALKAGLQRASYDDLRWGCQVTGAVSGFARELPALLDATSADLGTVEAALPPVGVRLIRLGRRLPAAFTHRGPVAFMMGVFAAMITSHVPSCRRELSQAVEEWVAVEPKLALLTEIALALPERWRPALAPITGMSYFARLQADERDALIAELRERDSGQLILPNLPPM